MNTIIGYLVSYLVGGLTLIPLTIFLIWSLSETVPTEAAKRDELDAQKEALLSREKGEPTGYRDLKACEVIEAQQLGIHANFSGWITITKEFHRFPQIHPYEFKTTNADLTTSPDSTPNTGIFNKIIKSTNTNGALESSSLDNKDSVEVSDESSASKLKQIRKRSRFYGVLKHGNLFLYADDTKKDVKHVIVLDHYVVSIWPRNLTDSQLFTKRSAICLIKLDEFMQSPEKSKELRDILNGSSKSNTAPKNSYFLYGDTNIEKETWYFELIKAITKDDISTGDISDNLKPSIMAKTLHYKTAFIVDLIENINATEGQLTTKWLNALIGRLFLASYQTEEFKLAFKEKIEYKLHKIRTPGFLDQLQIQRIDVGNAAPLFTNPKLKHITPEGDLELTIDVLYKGKAMVEIATKFFLNMGSHFKQRQFDIIMKLVCNKLEGELLIKMKPQPSSRIWYTFTKMPQIDLDIQPVFSSKALNYGIVTGTLESKLKEAIKTSIVYPFFDDFVFFKSPDEVFRGGIFDRSVRKEGDLEKPGAEFEMQSTEKTAETDIMPVASSNASINSKASNSTGMNRFSDNDSRVTRLDTIASSDDFEQLVTPKPVGVLFDQDTSQIKSSVIKSYSKIKQWYKTNSQTENGSPRNSMFSNVNRSKSGSVGTTDLNYTPPEMISNRRRKPSKAEADIDTDQIPSNIATNGHIRPSADAFINLERKRGESQSSRFGSISSLEDSNPLPHTVPLMNVPLTPTSPGMFINEKFKSPSAPNRDAVDHRSNISNSRTIRYNHNDRSEVLDKPNLNYSVPASNPNFNTSVLKLDESPILKTSTFFDEENSTGPQLNDFSVQKHKHLRKPPPLPRREVDDAGENGNL